MPGSVVTPSERLDLERMQQLMLMGVQTEEDEEEYSEFLFLSWALLEEQRQSDAPRHSSFDASKPSIAAALLLVPCRPCQLLAST